MSMSPPEWRSFREIERGLSADDPAFARRLAATTVWPMPAARGPGARRAVPIRVRERLAWLMVAAGTELVLVGFLSARGLISGGTIVGLYGLVIMLLAVPPAGRALAQRRGWRRPDRWHRPGFNPNR